MYKETLGKDLFKIEQVEAFTQLLARRTVGIGIAIVFLSIVWIAADALSQGVDNQTLIVAAGVIGGYMALNIGANDVANNVGPAVGAKSLTLAGALVLAAVFESAGAYFAGGDVVKTISKGIVDADQFADTNVFMWAMMSALLAAALWINLATFLGAPVSTTHSIVGGVAGAAIAAAGIGIVDWSVMGKIIASWVVSPVLGGVIAALFLYFIKLEIIYQPDKVAGAKRWIPVLVAIMAGAFSSYFIMKGLGKIWRPAPWVPAAIGVAVFAGTYIMVRPWIARRAAGMENRNRSVRELFHLPLVLAAALLSFAHGANDVANAVGPLAAIVDAAATGKVSQKVGIPSWVLFVGAAGITMGLLLFGPKLIRTVGDQITRLNPMRAYCVALSAAITVIVASALGLPVSSTHIAVGAVFGVGFLREYFTTRKTHIHHGKFPDKRPSEWDALSRAERADRRMLVRRQHLKTIAAAWIITVPCSALLSAAVFCVCRNLLS
ncbi:MAG: inorganic phosphate transporter [Rhodospirillaceae bacterium]